MLRLRILAAVGVCVLLAIALATTPGDGSAIGEPGGPPRVRPGVIAALQAQTEVSVIVSLREPPALGAATPDTGVLEAQVAEGQQRVVSAPRRQFLWPKC